ncbi:MAG: histidinol-phosphatase HisJ family protein [Lachnospiraceae bacterium]|nr:histidinol-phosphatase HisJ family protein [Lachnospiraceae bacterium]
MISDYHVHSHFSGDSDTQPEDIIRRAIELEMSSICFTDHYDLDYPDEPEIFLLDISRYFESLRLLQDKYSAHIQIRIGLELGLQQHLQKECCAIAAAYPFDFIIGSSHVVNHRDPYYPSYFEGRTEEDGYREYFQSILDNLTVFEDFDVYGHLDYVIRYGPNQDQFYSYAQYQDILEQILKTCLEKNIGLELNTGGLARGLRHPHPHPDILKRYQELGGEILTIGSDAHISQNLAYDFHKIRDFLEYCGFSYYTVFEKRKPQFIKL